MAPSCPHCYHVCPRCPWCYHDCHPSDVNDTLLYPSVLFHTNPMQSVPSNLSTPVYAPSASTSQAQSSINVVPESHFPRLEQTPNTSLPDQTRTPLGATAYLGQDYDTQIPGQPAPRPNPCTTLNLDYSHMSTAGPHQAQVPENESHNSRGFACTATTLPGADVNPATHFRRQHQLLPQIIARDTRISDNLAPQPVQIPDPQFPLALTAAHSMGGMLLTPPAHSQLVSASDINAHSATGTRPHNCPNCGRSFERRWDMNRHARGHGTRTLRCDVKGCTRRSGFHRRDKLNDHKKVHKRHGGDDGAC